MRITLIILSNEKEKFPLNVKKAFMRRQLQLIRKKNDISIVVIKCRVS